MLNQFLKNIIRNAVIEHAHSDSVVRVAPKNFCSDTIRIPKEFQAQTLADDV